MTFASCPPMNNPSTIFLTGATGYIGGRLAPRLLDRGHVLRCLTRNREKLRARPWASHVDIVDAALSDEDALTKAMRGCDLAYYLVHSMNAAGAEYRNRDRQLAETFSRAAARANVPRIIYLGGLGETGDALSEHLSSRREVEAALASTSVALTTLRAAMIIGAGSASFEILRYLVERLPVMVTPRWVRTLSQPIAIQDVLRYLVAALETPDTARRTIDIGGPDIVSYAHLIQMLAASLKLPKRVIIPVPFLTPRLSSLWIHLVTPLPTEVARPLAEGLKNRVVCRNNNAHVLMPHECLTVQQAMDAALEQTNSGYIHTAWSDAGVMPGDPDWAGGKEFIDRREASANASPHDAWRAVLSLGGTHGYFAHNWLWRTRGRLDKFVGGPGLRRGRRSQHQLRLGDAVDFWRVTAIEAPGKLQLTAEMKVPGHATLTFEVQPDPNDHQRSTIVMTARFAPRGLTGLVYWYSIVPLHGAVFRGTLNGLIRAAERTQPEPPALPSIP
jgi:uncharacterized protein YbjT (DUF2867 family)